MHRADPIPIIDLFAGPGGLGEGFSAFATTSDAAPFKIALSIEMEHWAHQTLALRSFFHAFPRHHAPHEYYAHLRGEMTRAELFASFPEEAREAEERAWKAELGAADSVEVDRRIRRALRSSDHWILCGGPPCQAFSIVGRSRNGGISDTDKRVYLYRQYLRILAAHEPAVFIIENVKGLLSSYVKGNDIFEQMLDDLRHPAAVARTPRKSGARYSLHSLAAKDLSKIKQRDEPRDFVVKCEDYGIPQCRHRVIILGVREDIAVPAIPALTPYGRPVSTRAVLRGLPPLRSGVSRSEDGLEQWKAARASIRRLDFMSSRRNGNERVLRERLMDVLAGESGFSPDRGQEFIPCIPSSDYKPDWFLDTAMGGVCNHTSRPHMTSDLHRYLFVACYAKVHGRSPELKDFPVELHPHHASLTAALNKGHFDDRFRVQIADRPSTTITSHIAKDGHYFIHYDENQCRSLTVREAARLQTFPDNYYFCGQRTHQYRQVGNAVPPLLAYQIASLVDQILSGKRATTSATQKRLFQEPRVAANG